MVGGGGWLWGTKWWGVCKLSGPHFLQKSVTIADSIESAEPALRAEFGVCLILLPSAHFIRLSIFNALRNLTTRFVKNAGWVFFLGAGACIFLPAYAEGV